MQKPAGAMSFVRSRVLVVARGRLNASLHQTQQMFTRARVFQESEKEKSAGKIASSDRVELPRRGQGEKMHKVSSFLNVLSL